MQTPHWNRTLGEVLNRQTVKMKLVSKSGTEYTTDVIPKLDLIAVGSATAKKDENGRITGYSYQVYDSMNDLGNFSITTTNLVEVKTVKKMQFVNVRGGSLSSRASGWFKADRAVALK